jgi:hypothetical protein
MGAQVLNTWVAEPFTVTQDSYATALGAAAGRAYGPTNAGFDAYLTATLSGLPGSELAKLPNPLVPLNTQYVYYDGGLSAPVLLNAGVVYYVVLMPSSPDFCGSVSWSTKSGSYYGLGTSDNGSHWGTLAYPLCVRVDGYVVPEPGAMSAMLAGLLAIGLRRRRWFPCG